MLEFVGQAASERKLRLFGIACVRRVWQLLEEYPDVMLAVNIVERFVDGLATTDEQISALESVQGLLDQIDRQESGVARPVVLAVTAAYEVCWNAYADVLARSLERPAAHPSYRNYRDALRPASSAAKYAALATHQAGRSSHEVERAVQADLFRCIFGHMKPGLSIDLAWAPSNSATLKKLALVAYQSRLLPEGTIDPTTIQILSDAFEETGLIESSPILSHYREDVTHVPGCWVLDTILGKT
jgi:hypothetical protein